MQNFQVQFLQYSLAFYATCPAHRLLDLITAMAFRKTRKFEDLHRFCSTLGLATVHFSISFSQTNLFFPLIGTHFHKHTKLGANLYFRIYLSLRFQAAKDRLKNECRQDLNTLLLSQSNFNLSASFSVFQSGGGKKTCG